MPKRPSISPTRRARIVELRRQKFKYSDIAAAENCSLTACKSAVKLYTATGQYVDRKRCGRPRKTNRRQDRVIQRLALTDRFTTSRVISNELRLNHGVIIDPRTVRRRLNHFGLFGRVAKKKPLISRRNRLRRLEFARDHLNWTVEQWAQVTWSDEKKFNRFGNDGAGYVWRKKGEALAPQCIRPTVKGGGGSVMVWACFSRSGPGPIHRINGIMDAHVYRDILTNVLLPHSEENLPLSWKFQQDNDPKHTSRIVREWFIDNQINILDWPSQSLDLNPIENLWALSDRDVKKKKPKNLNELFDNIADCWANMSPVICTKLVDSMQRRCQAVIKNFGYPTRY